MAGEECKGGCINEAVDCSDEGPTNSGIHGDVLSQGNTEDHRVAIQEELREFVGDNHAEEAGVDGVGNLRDSGWVTAPVRQMGSKGCVGSSNSMKLATQDGLVAVKALWKE